ncbi:hypothetical protein LOTGIDRAFT_157605 [Lottia gigantea]|uniref:tRNA wybutosine-synthesizing protein 3 homolog n=1 Tax=Lottia gigantea TaxID=225164 RepID=V4B5T2_LOTGI|nr:hypothetical protein LOTGIDRAFT_157605 [Lottia gigantea]ESP01422.1 hypothetical protein LOTGIDRAFT_157605 [Lottia gigantea]
MSDLKFEKQKSECLSGIDWSRKGSVDIPIGDLVQYINSLNHYFTTSSCSGRIMVFQQEDSSIIQKKGCQWLYTTHEDAQLKPMVESLKNITGNAVFKFEPFVLHVQCKCIEDAQKLHTVAIASGFRNSGITIGSKGKIIMAVRSTHSLEVPLSIKGEVLVSEKYLYHLVQLANEKLHENFCRIQR